MRAAAMWLVLALAAAGCDGAGAQERVELGLDDLPPSAGVEAAAESWQSVGWQGDPWHAYGGETTLAVAHELGRVPQSVLVYVAFDPSGSGAGLATGDMARVIEVTADRVTIRNDTEADFFCRIVLR